MFGTPRKTADFFAGMFGYSKKQEEPSSRTQNVNGVKIRVFVSETSGSHNLWLDQIVHESPQELRDEVDNATQLTEGTYEGLQEKVTNSLRSGSQLEQILVNRFQGYKSDDNYRNRLAIAIYNQLASENNKWETLFDLMNPVDKRSEFWIVHHINFFHILLLAVTEQNLDAIFCWFVAFASWKTRGIVVYQGIKDPLEKSLTLGTFEFQRLESAKKKKDVVTILVNFPYSMDKSDFSETNITL